MKKRILSFILSLTLIVSVLCFSNGKTVHALSKSEILNSAELYPLKCGVDYVDSYVEDLFSQIFTANMTTYEKVKACYDHIIYNTEYGVSGWYNGVEDLIYNEYYKSETDAFIIYYGYTLLTTGYGVCNDYASAFVLLTRALGLESYLMSGQTNTTSGEYAGHMWVNVIINGTYYSFDPQVEDNITDRSSNGKIGYYRFCSTDKEMKEKLIYADRQGDIDSFCNFEKYGEYKAIVSPNKTGTVKIGEELSFGMSFENVALGEVAYGLYIREGDFPEIDVNNIVAVEQTYVEGDSIKWLVDRTGTFTLYMYTQDGYGRSDYTAMLYIFVQKIQILLGGNYVYGIPCNTKTADCKLKDSEKIIDSLGNELDNEKYISTGNKYVSENKEYSIVVKGDTNGDGEVTTTDYLQIKKAFLDQLVLENEYFIAADTDSDEMLTSTDYLQVKNYFLGLFDLYK